VGNIFFQEPGIANMAIGGAVAGLFFGIQVWLSKETWLGKGDTQVGILMGMFFGFKLFIISLVIIYLIGLIITVPLLLAKKVTKKTRIPFAPFMVISTFITLFFGEYLYNFYFGTLL
jgi:prepilin signal peptidase PulO-like enzyme (type II secretory pathway)